MHWGVLELDDHGTENTVVCQSFLEGFLQLLRGFPTAEPGMPVIVALWSALFQQAL